MIEALNQKVKGKNLRRSLSAKKIFNVSESKKNKIEKEKYRNSNTNKKFKWNF